MEMRINKYLSSVGYCSRREADKLVEENRVTIEGVLATPGSKVLEGQVVAVDGKAIAFTEKPVMLAVNKPKGVVCTTKNGQGGIPITEYINYSTRIYPVGRLDKESTGLILMTNIGELSDGIMRSRNGHEKEYEVEVDKAITPDFIEKMSRGVYLKELDRTTNPCFVEKTGFKTFRIILTQGLNRQIRRMCQELGYRVKELNRIRIMNITLGDIPKGQYRELTSKEINDLKRQVGIHG